MALQVAPGTVTAPSSPVADFPPLSDLEAAASRVVAADVWSYVEGGAAEELTLMANRDAFHRRCLRPRVLAGVKEVDLTTRVLGSELAAPLYVSPMAYQAHVHPDGEIGVARATSAVGVGLMLGTLSSHPLEAVAREAPASARWFQLYLQPKFRDSQRLVERAEAAGFGAIVVTVDVPIFAKRDRQLKGGFAVDGTTPIGNGPEFVAPPRQPRRAGASFLLQDDRAADWSMLERLADVTSLPLVVKGIMTGDDARRAVEHGARAVVVSNHGGRQLDGAEASLDALPEVVAASGGKIEVYLDGGVRRGRDVAVALALGARAVGLGRPVLWALAVGGAAGVQRYLEMLTDELANTMFLLGRARPSDLSSDIVSSI